MSSKRIGLLVYGLDRPLTGISRYTVELVRAYARLSPRPNITLLTVGGLGPLAEENQFPVIPLRGCTRLPALFTVGQLALRRIVRRERFDLIHDLTGITPFGLLPESVETCVTIHDVFALSFPGYSSRLDTWIYRYWLPRVSLKIDKVVTPSMYSKREIVNWLGISAETITCIPQGIHPRFKPITPAASQAYILYVGNLITRKNLDRALAAFAQIHTDYPSLEFVIAGPTTWENTHLQTKIEALGITKQVRIVGSISDSELTRLYQHARLFLFPSLYEGFGFPPLEAMACGIPVLTSNVSSLPEVVGDAALLVNPHDIDAIGQGLRQILDSQHYSEMLSRRGVARAAQFTWEATAQKTVDLYER